MGRARGTYTVHTNWVDDLAPSLPGAAGWVLQRLDAQTNYKRQTLTVGQLTDALPFKERTVQQALAYLVQEGYAIGAGREYVLHGACTELAQALRKDARNGQAQNAVSAQESVEIYSAISTHNQKESEGSEGIEEREEQIQHKAQESTAPVEASPSQESVLETNTPAAVRSDAPALEKVPRRRAAPAEMPEMPADLAALPGLPAAWAEWLTYRKQRRLSTAPATASGMFVKLREFATEGLDPVGVIRNSIAQGYQGLFPAKAHIVRFNPAARTTEEANDRVRNRARELYNASKETRRAVF